MTSNNIVLVIPAALLCIAFLYSTCYIYVWLTVALLYPNLEMYVTFVCEDREQYLKLSWPCCMILQNLFFISKPNVT